MILFYGRLSRNVKFGCLIELHVVGEVGVGSAE